MIHADVFTLDILVDQDRNTVEDKNHLTAIIKTTSRSLRVSMKSRTNKKTGQRGLLVLHLLSYTGPFWTTSSPPRDIHVAEIRDKVREALVIILSRGWHQLKMSTTPEEAKINGRKSFPVFFLFIHSNAKIEKPQFLSRPLKKKNSTQPKVFSSPFLLSSTT